MRSADDSPSQEKVIDVTAVVAAIGDRVDPLGKEGMRTRPFGEDAVCGMKVEGSFKSFLM